MKYRKKPMVVEAVQWTGLNLEEVKKFVGGALTYIINDTAWKVGKGRPRVYMKIRTLEGEIEVSEKDFIIKGVNGEFYPCKPDIFQKTYAPEDERQTIYDPGRVVEQLKERTAFLKDCTKYGNETAEQQAKSYGTMMMYEVKDLVDDLTEIVKGGGADG